MKKKFCTIIIPFLLFLLGTVCHLSAQNDKDIEIIRDRFITELMQSPVNDNKVKQLLDNFRRDSIWPGIDYADVSNTGFQHRIHLDNLVYLSRAYKQKASQFKGNRELKRTFDQALAFWLMNDFICENWWWNQIGTPSAMISILLIMDKDLSPQQIKGILPLAGRANMEASGARPSGDRIKIAGLLAKTALFNRNIKLVDSIMPIIEEEIKFSNGSRGLQYDYSFHHRVDRVNNTTSYGLSYASTFVEWAAHIIGTRYAFSDNSIRILVDFYLDGICKQMVYGRFTDTGVLNRDITRVQGGGSSPVIPLKLMQVTEYRKDELANIAAIRSGKSASIPSFSKFFWQSEHFVFQRPHYYTSIRMFSSRNANMEVPYNGEGLANHYRGDGTNYLSLTGKEYSRLPPVYDWMKIPGTTIMQSDKMPPENEIQKNGLTDFVGGVSNGVYGAAAFDFKSPHNPLSAKKSWFFFDKEYICLGAGLTSSSSRTVVTTLEQSHLMGDVVISSDKNRTVLPQGKHLQKEADWLYHNQVGYLFHTKQNVCLSNEEEKGDWFRINRSTSSSKELVKEDVFKLWIDHGSRLNDATYEYVVMPSTTQSDLIAYTAAPLIKTVVNTSEYQAVWHELLNIGYAVFYKGGTIPVSEEIELTSDSPGMVMFCCNKEGQIQEITVADPSRKLKRLHLRVNQKISTNSESCTATWNTSIAQTLLGISLPQDGYEGNSITIAFNK